MRVVVGLQILALLVLAATVLPQAGSPAGAVRVAYILFAAAALSRCAWRATARTHRVTNGSALWRGAGVFIVGVIGALLGNATWHGSLQAADPLSALGISIVATGGWAFGDWRRRRVRP